MQPPPPSGTEPSVDESVPPLRRRERRDAPRIARRDRQPSPRQRIESSLRELGPGLITGAADDDPSGIATYSQAGAAFGYGLLWTALVSLPLMSAVQIMCARIGVVTQSGLASVLRQHYSRSLLWFACALLLIGNTVNIAADLGGMGAAAELLTGIPAVWFVPVFGVGILALLTFASYAGMTRVLKWLTLSLFAYVLAAFFAQPSWPQVLRGTLAPHLTWSKEYLLMFVAILGTTISPYLFFWQAAQNAEQDALLGRQIADRPRRSVHRELRSAAKDVKAGMLLSNAIMFFIILTAAGTLHRAGVTNVDSAAAAAAALRPVAGKAAALLFTLGILTTGLLGVPVLAGSAAYAVAEAAAWRSGMDESFRSARHFYGVMAVAMAAGMALTLARVNAIQLLIGSAVINGLLAPPLILIVLIVCNNKGVMGHHRNGRWLNLLGGAAATLMTGAAVALILSWVI